MDDELLFRPVTELALLVRDRHVAPVELTEAALRRIERLDGTLNAFVDVDAEGALAQAAAAPRDAPARGIPIAVKANTAVAGRPLHMASRLLEHHRATEDAFLVRRLRDAGFAIVGLTNLPEFGILPTTEPRFGGATRNPWDLSRTPGGSSGGSGAAVAAGMVPVAHGNDGGGSIRIPAACCHLVGLKPSRGRISRGPAQGDSFLGTDGVLTRTVADAAALLDVLAGYEAGDATWAPPPGEPYVAAMRRDPGRLRIAVSTANIWGGEVDDVGRRALTDAAELLSALGHEVTLAAPALPGDAMELFTRTFWTLIATGPAFGARVAGREPREDDIEPLTRAVFERAAAIPGHVYVADVQRLQQIARGVVAFFARHHLLLTPVLAQRPLPIGELTGCGEDPIADFMRSAQFVPYTALFNATGQPAISVPMGIAGDGLPTAVQLVGRPLCEDVLLQVAAQLEDARPWAQARPPEVAMRGRGSA